MSTIASLRLVICREYQVRVHKRSFWILTILTPLLICMAVGAPILLSYMSSEDAPTLAVLDHTGRYVSLLSDGSDYRFVSVSSQTLDSCRVKAEQMGIDGVLEIRGDLLQNPSALSLYTFRQLPSSIEDYINHRLSSYLRDQKVDSYAIPELRQIISNCRVEIKVPTYKWDASGQEQKSSSDIVSALGMVLSLLSYMFITVYGSMVLYGVLEEKKSRIVEVMLCTIRPFELMMGKIIGIGLVGLTQMLICGVMLSSLFVSLSSLAGGVDSNTLSELVSELRSSLQSIPWVEILVMFVLYFVGGYLVYASLFAMLGSLISTDEDAGQMVMPITLLLIFAMYAGMSTSQHPDSTFAICCSWIPFTSPVVMMGRMAYGVPLWEQILSIALLYLSFVGITYLCGRIYRVGILLYGKKPSLRELWCWLHYK